MFQNLRAKRINCSCHHPRRVSEHCLILHMPSPSGPHQSENINGIFLAAPSCRGLAFKYPWSTHMLKAWSLTRTDCSPPFFLSCTVVLFLSDCHDLAFSLASSSQFHTGLPYIRHKKPWTGTSEAMSMDRFFFLLWCFCFVLFYFLNLEPALLFCHRDRKKMLRNFTT